jgi:hypothetical protein
MVGDQTNVGETFRVNIRKYNSALSFTSMGVIYDKDLANAREGVYTYRIQGAVVHEMGPLRPEEGKDCTFAQISFYNPDEQTARRGDIFDGALDAVQLRAVEETLRESNQFCHAYKTIQDREKRATASRGGPRA